MRLRPHHLALLLTVALPLAACGANDPSEGTKTGGNAPVASAQVRAAPGLFTHDQIEQAMPSAQPASAPTTPAPASPNGQPAATPPDPAMIRLQVLLDRSSFSPGVIDGLHGENVRQAIAAYREAKGLGTGDAVDAALIQSLATADAQPVMTEYVLTPADVGGPFSPSPAGEDLSVQAAQGTNFSTARERIAERFHMSEDLLQALNPSVDFARAGVAILIPALIDRPLPQVARIEVDKAEKAVKAYDAAGTLIAFYPATIGSGDNLSPSGNLTVVGVAPEPDYLYDPSRLTFGKGERVIVPAGPNNPVGSVWIDLSRDTYGIHGTPDPSKIGKTASHGCVRLTNWDAEQLAAAVKPGVPVRFV